MTKQQASSIRMRSCVATFALLLSPIVLCTGCPPSDRRMTREPTVSSSELQRRAMNLLTDATRSEFEDVAMNAIEALTRVAPERGVPHFRRAAREAGVPVRFAALVALGEVRDCDSRGLFNAAVRDPHPQVRLAGAFAALRCGGSEAVYGPIVAAALNNPTSEGLRGNAAFLLGRLGQPRAVPRLQIVERRDRSSKVAIQAIAAMAELGDPHALQRLIAYTQGDKIARLLALQALADLEEIKARDALLAQLWSDSGDDPIVFRLIAARGLGRIRIPDGYDFAIEQLHDAELLDIEDERKRFDEMLSIRQNSALALGAIGDERALGALSDLAETGFPPEQVAAAQAILEIVGTQRTPQLPALPRRAARQ